MKNIIIKKNQNENNFNFKNFIINFILIFRILISSFFSIFIIYLTFLTLKKMNEKKDSSFISIFITEIPTCINNILKIIPVFLNIKNYFSNLINDNEKNFLLFLFSFFFTLISLIYFCN